VKKRLRSLRAYIDALAALGDLREIRAEVDTDLEIGAVIRRSNETHGPAPLFTTIRGHAGTRILGAPGTLSSLPGARWARAALSLGLDPTTPALGIVEELAAAWSREPVPPVVTDTGPCRQNVLLGDEASLDALPIPLLHHGDGGRYVNTWGAIVVRTPDGTWTNWSITRVMKLDGRTMTGLISPTQDIGRIHRMWRERGEPMPFAIVQGCEPAVPFVCGMGLPPGTDECGWLGAWFGEPVELVRCRTVDLEVPAEAEIVIEGHVAVDETAPEGPMGDYFGYLHGPSRPQPVFHVSAVTHRDDPILPVVSAGKPVDEDHTVVALAYSADALASLRAAGLPVTSAWLVPESAVSLLVITVPADWRQRGPYTGSRMLTRALTQNALHPKVDFWLSRIMVTDDDIDPTDPRDVLWAHSTRSHPVRGQVPVEDQPINPFLLPYSPEERAAGGTKMAYDCLLPADAGTRPALASFDGNFPAAVRRRALDIWED
jgi:UbiD family decarboxylase